jgi:hypothetical protein
MILSYVEIYVGLQVFFLLSWDFFTNFFFLDPLPPVLQTSTSSTFYLKWEPIRFCGVSRPDIINSITFSIEVSEGVDWKENALAKYMNDNIASKYKTVFRGKNVNFAVLEDLKPAKWYHIRLAVDYLGIQVTSESISYHTLRSPPSTPGMPRVAVVPVRNSFDNLTLVPSRLDLLISWNASVSNGYPIDRYQVHLKRFDTNGKILVDDPPVLKKKPQHTVVHTNKAIGKLIKIPKQHNQWIGSPGKSETQIRNSLNSRSGLRSRSPSPNGRHTPATPSSPIPDNSQFASFIDSQTPLQGNRRPQTWKIIYDNLNRTVKLFAPKEGDGEWWIRVRAKNAVGWSSFSPLLVINHYNFPSLFPSPMLKQVEHHDEYYQFFYPSNSPNHPVNQQGGQYQIPPHIMILAPPNYQRDFSIAENKNIDNGKSPKHAQDHIHEQQQHHNLESNLEPINYYNNIPENFLPMSNDPFGSHDMSIGSSRSPKHQIQTVNGIPLKDDPSKEYYISLAKSTPSVDDNDSTSSFHFRGNRHHQQQAKDSLRDHQDEVGLFWDHKVMSNEPQKPINPPHHPRPHIPAEYADNMNVNF